MSTRLAQAQAFLESQDYTQALATAQKVVQTGQNLPQAHTIVGMSAQGLGKLTLARSAFEKAIHYNPQNTQVWSNLARFALATSNFALAKDALTKLQQLGLTDAETICALASACVGLGDYAQARLLLQGVLAESPQHPRATSLYLTMQTDTLPIEDWEPYWQNMPTGQWSAEFNCLVTQLKMLWAWATGSPDLLTYMHLLQGQMERAEGQGQSNHVILTNGRAYLRMLLQLQRFAPVPALNPQLPAVYMLGDSHVLPPQRQTVQWQGQPHQLHARPVIGLKLWHFAQPEENFNRHAFLAQLEALPPNATVIVSAGEIDSRANFGIYAHARKYNKPWQQVIKATIPPALAWLKRQQGGRTFILGGIPDVNPLQLEAIPADLHADYLACKTAIQAELAQQAALNGIPYINMYAYTHENASSFVDDHHLVPSALPQALQSHLVQPA